MAELTLTNKVTNIEVQSNDSKVTDIYLKKEEITISPINKQIEVKNRVNNIDINPIQSPELDLVTTPVFRVGPRGLSAYQVAVALGFTGNEQQWLESLKAELTWASTNW